MALPLICNNTCSICGQKISPGECYYSSTFMGIKDPRFAYVDDGVVHCPCFDRWDLKGAFVDAWNECARSPHSWMQIDEQGKLTDFPMLRAYWHRVTGKPAPRYYRPPPHAGFASSST